MSETSAASTPQSDIFLPSLQAITSGRAGLGELIGISGALNAAGRRAESAELYKVWISLNRESPFLHMAQFNCACLLSDLGDALGAAQMLTEALAKDPTFQPAHINLGGLLERAGRVEDALAQWRKGLSYLETLTGPSLEYKLTGLKQMGRVLSDEHRPGEAEAVLLEALQLNPDQRDVLGQWVGLRTGQVKWPVIQTWDGVSRQRLLTLAQPLTLATYTDDPLLHLAQAARYIEATIDEDKVDPATDRRDAPIDLSRRLRIGYVSSDLRDHAIGYLMSEFFELHNKEKVEVFAYACGKAGETPHTTRIKSVVEHWRDIHNLSDDEAARLIANDEIDILVDVNGHTRDCRTAVFARRPAPIQVNWLGFPGPMGSPYHHYIIADPWIIPPEYEKYYAEKVVRLPCYQPNDRRRVVAERPTRASVGLPEDAFVFCAFNGVQKFTRFTFERWMEILKRVPGSVLWVLDHTPESTESINGHATRLGVDPARIIWAPKVANPFHLARYPLADLFLDSSPYGAHTTCSDALWMAVPILTMSGRSFASRVCGSLLRAAGLPELIASSPELYIEIAVALANDRAALNGYKARLEANRATCDLFNMDLLTSSIEDLYRQMAEDYVREGAPPQPDLTNLHVYGDVGLDFDHDAEEMQMVRDYDGYYRAGLAKRDRMRPLTPDNRLWPGPIAELTGEPPQTEASAATSKSKSKARKAQPA